MEYSSASTGASPAATEEQGRAHAQASTPSGMQTPSSFSSMPETSVVGGIQVTKVGAPRFQTEETVLGSQKLNDEEKAELGYTFHEWPVSELSA